MSPGHDARTIANCLIEQGRSSRQPLDPLQIIKLTYLCHGWMLGLYCRPLSRQYIEAWKYGPVVADVYHSLKRYGRSAVTRPIECPDGDFNRTEKDLINEVYEVYNKYSGIELSMMTHAQGTPWHTIWNRYGRNEIIPDDLIDAHFLELATEQ